MIILVLISFFPSSFTSYKATKENLAKYTECINYASAFVDSMPSGSQHVKIDKFNLFMDAVRKEKFVMGQLPPSFYEKEVEALSYIDFFAYYTIELMKQRVEAPVYTKTTNNLDFFTTILSKWIAKRGEIFEGENKVANLKTAYALDGFHRLRFEMITCDCWAFFSEMETNFIKLKTVFEKRASVAKDAYYLLIEFGYGTSSITPL